jgi:ligand-binding sensor domain-containing protein/serine phosphatase RsbU (regulator of sigma subunit)
MTKRLGLNTLFILLPFLLLAQSHRFKHITSEDGLPVNFISSIIQDRNGFMWFGTQDGLCRYDGYHFKTYKQTADKNSLSSSDVKSVYEHSDGTIYVGTRNSGLNIYNPALNTVERVRIGRDASSRGNEIGVNCFFNLDNENILMGTSKGLVNFNVKTKHGDFVAVPKLNKVEINAIYKYDNKIFLCTEGNGLWIYNKNATAYRIGLINVQPEKLDTTEIATVKAITDHNGKLYVASFGEGVLKVDPNTFKIEKIYRTNSDNDNVNFIEDIKTKDNQIYAITRKGGLVIDPINERTELFEKNEADKYSLNDNYLTAVYIDDQKNVWLGTFSGGVNIAFSKGQRFSNFPRHISEEFVHTFAIYDDGKELWVAGEKFLKSFHLPSQKVSDFSPVTEGNYVLSLTGDKENNLYIGTWGVGVFKYNVISGKKEKFLSEGSGGTIVSLFQDKDGKLWIGSYGDGLFILNTKTSEIRHYSDDDGLSNNNIMAIVRDSKNNIWLGTDGGGVCLVKNGDIGDRKSIQKFFNVDTANSICSNIVYSIHEDKNGVMWFATSNGLSRYDVSSHKFTNYSERDGLANNFIYSVLNDSLGNIWMSTNKGLTRFNPNLENLGTAFKNYDQKDGLLNSEYTQGAYCKTKKGKMVFGGANGINIFDPSTIKDNKHLPPVYVISYKRGGKDVETDSAIIYKKFIQLDWRENFLQFELAALDYNSPAENRYMYMLEGYDKEWSAATNIRYVSYTELPGGDYTFKVKACNNDGIWNEKPYYIHIKVIPPFWKTMWFYILVSVFGIAGVILFIQLRTRAVKRENKILENKVMERTKELAEKNRDITSSIEYAKRIQEAILPAKDQIFSKFENMFILYKPKDIVSGDFYWYGNKNGFKIFAAVDCTGHGVPGAFMSMIGHNILNQVVIEKGITNPGEILNNLHKGVQQALKQGQNQVNTNDGMDVSMISVSETTGEIFWAGAFRPVVIVRADGSLEKIDGDKYSVGGAQTNVNRKFHTHKLNLNSQDTIYLYSDGYADQFGGEKGKKYMVKRFNELLCSIHAQGMQEQQNELLQAFEEWRGVHEQIDDVLVVGIRF